MNAWFADPGVSRIVVAMALAVPLLFAALVARWPALARDALAVAALPLLLVVLLARPEAPLEIGSVLLGARFGVDEWSTPMLVLCALVWSAAGVALPAYAGSDGAARIAPWWLLTLAGQAGLTLALDAVSFFVFFALMSFAAYALVVQRRDAAALQAARRYMVFVIIGEVALFNALVLPATGYPELRNLLLVAGFGIKAALFGLHAWLPLAHTAAPAPASATLSGAMLAAGVLGWLRFVEPGAVPDLGLALAALGVVGALYGAVVGVFQVAPKAVLAYSSVAQMGLLAVAVGAHLEGHPGAGALAAWYALHHGVAKAGLFLAVALAERSTGAARRWLLMGSLLPAAAIVGLPFTAGAALKTQLKGVAATGFEPALAVPLGFALIAATVGSTLLMLRTLTCLPRGDRALAPGSLACGWGGLVVAGAALALVGPVGHAPFSADMLLPCAVGACLMLVVIALTRGGILPRNVAPAGASGLVAPLRVHVVRGVVFEPAHVDVRLREFSSILRDAVSRGAGRGETALRDGMAAGVGLLLVILLIAGGAFVAGT